MAQLDEKRQRTVEQGWLDSSSEARTLLRKQPAAARESGVDPASVEYMDYCAHVGDVAGQVGMAHLYHSGTHGVPRDTAAAAHWFAAAAAKGDPMGHANLGLVRLRAGDGAGALPPLRRAAKRSDPSGWAGLGYAYYYGLGVRQDYALAAKALSAAARLGHLDAIFNLGVLALRGEGMEQSLHKAERFWRVAADFSHPMAQYYIGRMKARGLGTRRDCETALFFLQHAAAAWPAGNGLLETGLAAHEADRPQRALVHYLLGAHAGLEPALHNAGFLYAEAMPRRQPQLAASYRGAASEYFRRAAVLGSVDASIRLALLLSEDLTAEHSASSWRLANELYAEAARHGSADATWHLGYNYLKGRGLPKDWARPSPLCSSPTWLEPARSYPEPSCRGAHGR